MCVCVCVCVCKYSVYFLSFWPLIQFVFRPNRTNMYMISCLELYIRGSVKLAQLPVIDS